MSAPTHKTENFFEKKKVWKQKRVFLVSKKIIDFKIRWSFFLLVFFMIVMSNEWGIFIMNEWLENQFILQIKVHLVYWL